MALGRRRIYRSCGRGRRWRRRGLRLVRAARLAAATRGSLGQDVRGNLEQRRPASVPAPRDCHETVRCSVGTETAPPDMLWQLDAGSTATEATSAAPWRGPYTFAITGGAANLSSSTPMLHRFASAAEARRQAARKKHRLRLDGAKVCIPNLAVENVEAAVTVTSSSRAPGNQLFPFVVSTAGAAAVTWRLASDSVHGRASWVAAIETAAVTRNRRPVEPAGVPATEGMGAKQCALQPEAEHVTNTQSAQTLSVLVVFDFDHTLAITDVGKRHLAGDVDVAAAAFGGADRVGMLMTMLQELRAARVHVRILSYNSRATIVQAMDAAGLMPLLLGKGSDGSCDTKTVVLGCEDYTRGRGGRVVEISKSAEINARWLPVSATNVAADSAGGGSLKLQQHPRVKLLFVDDDMHNCEDVAANCSSDAAEVSVLHVNNGGNHRGDGGGMQARDCASVVKWVQSTTSNS